jgi:tetratricopeptide (TPR) repeat protein
MLLTSVRAIHVFPVALLLLQPVYGQQGGASPQPAPVTQPSGGTASPPPSSTPTAAAPATVPSTVWTPAPAPQAAPPIPQPNAGPVSVSGRVMTDDGQPFTDRVAIESVCDGVPRTEGYADKKGDFGVRVGDPNSGIIQDASVSTTDDYSSLPAAFPLPADPANPNKVIRRYVWANCEIRAKLAGYRSDSINVSNRSTFDSPYVGTLVLHKAGPVDGRVITVTSLAAPKSARTAFDKGQKALKNNQSDDARKDFETAVQIYPGYAAAWFELGRLSANRGDLDDGLRSYQKAIQADPKYVGPYLSVSAIEAVKKQWPQLLETTGALLRLDPYDYPQAYYMNALANYNLVNNDAAERSAREAEKLDSQGRLPIIRRLLGAILAGRRAFPEAVEQLREYLKFAPQAADAGTVREQVSQLETLAAAAVKTPSR